MTDLTRAVRYLYERFVLRDLLGHVTPGAIVLGTTAILFYYPVETRVLDRMMEVPGPAYLVVFGLLYVVGLAVGWLGEGIGVLSWHQRGTDADHVKRLRALHANGDEETWLRRERWASAKMVCGNNALAVLVASLLIAARMLDVSLSTWIFFPTAGAFFALLFMGVLFWGHRRMLSRQTEWEDASARR